MSVSGVSSKKGESRAHGVSEESEVLAARTRLGSRGLLGHVVEVLGGEVGGIGEGAIAQMETGQSFAFVKALRRKPTYRS